MRPLDPRLLRYATGVRRLLVVSVLLGVLTALVVIVQAVLIAGVLADVIIDGFDLPQVTDRLIALAVVIAVRAGLAWASEEIARRSAASVTAGLRRDLLVHAAGLGPRWRAGEQTGELAVLATTGIESLHDYIARYLPQVVLSTVIPVIMLVYLFSADLTSALIVLFTLPLIPLFMALVGWYTDRQTRSKWASLSRLAGHFTDVVAGLPTLKIFGRAKAQAEAVRKVTDDYRQASMVTLRVAFLSSMVLELLASLSVALVAVAIGLRLVYGDLTLQVGLAVLILAPEAYLPLRQLGTQFHAAADGVTAAGAALTILETPLPVPGDRRDVPAVPGFRLDRVVVGQPGERGTVGPLTLSIPAGAVTVVTGDSGAGKTTLLQLLAGVLRPTGGAVLVTAEAGGVTAEHPPVMPDARTRPTGGAETAHGRADATGPDSAGGPATAGGQPVANGAQESHGRRADPSEVAAGGAPGAGDRFSDGAIDLATVDPAVWRARLAWAGQGAALQAGSIRDNLALGNPGVDDDRLRAALEAADATGFVDALPQGWHTVLGEAGAGVSQGQRQRLALARALARPSGLVLLDEPTAALDEATEQRVLAGIARAVAGRTVVLVTHRPAPLALADQLLQLGGPDDATAEPDESASMAGEAESLTAVGPW